MLIRRVSAHAFGPLVGETLEFAEAMTVVYGANESAKSSWHAACYAALCGRRRGKGAQTIEERRFAELHKPWDGDDWAVSAEIGLDDGRRVEMRHDLNGKVDCHAKDLVLGADLSAEVMHDGTPDAARWLGLDRHSFAATACVFQTKVLAVLDRADGLQGHLQKAATSAGADQTAANALQRLEAFRIEQVGTERAATKPLRRAISGVQVGQAELDRARLAQLEYQDLVARARQLRFVSDADDRRLRMVEAARAAAQARAIRTKADQAIDLDRRLGGVAPPAPGAAEETSDLVAAALSAWRSRPVAPRPRAETSTVEPAVADRTSVGGVAAGDGPARVSDDELFDLARRLELVTPGVDPALDQRVFAAESIVAKQRQRVVTGRWLGVGAALVLLAAVSVLVLGEVPSGSAIGAVGLAIGGAALLTLRRADLTAAYQGLRSAQVAQATARNTATAVAAQRAEAEVHCVRIGVPADPDRLRALARERAGGVVLADRDDQWRQEFARADQAAAARVLAAAAMCGLATTDAEEAVGLLERWSQDRAAQAARADQSRQDWANLWALLDGRTLADLVTAADEARDLAAQARSGFTAEEIAAVGSVDDARLSELRGQARTAAEAAVAVEGSTKERARTLASVGEAEEQLLRAEDELARVRSLDETLTLTSRFLMAAQERVHRDIAPILADTVRAWLPEVTEGRYTDVIVDPRTLRVQVCGPSRRWRDADRLSFGTAEQVYLLLRIALAGLLAAPGKRCPLLLDDVTVHADAVRTKQILELLLVASQDRQIILFTQQEQVRDWARTRLADKPSTHFALREIPSLATV